jgi:hypothetical protein
MPGPVVQLGHKALGCPVALRFPYSPKYAAGGPRALTDGLLGPGRALLRDYSQWQGFESDDLDAVIDLGRKIPIETVRAGFLQNIGDWIFLPKAVAFAVSDDGETFHDLETVPNDVSPQKKGWLRHEFVVELPGDTISARYLRVVAANIRTCPDWHHGAGGKAWVFADEIIVE